LKSHDLKRSRKIFLQFTAAGFVDLRAAVPFSD
jgi:hypothetical protein